jgi:hypothetical protein
LAFFLAFFLVAFFFAGFFFAFFFANVLTPFRWQKRGLRNEETYHPEAPPGAHALRSAFSHSARSSPRETGLSRYA